MRFFVTFSFCGTAYHGSQIQRNAVSVQEIMQNAFSTILRENIVLTFASRTDAHVHAKMMVAHFDIDKVLGSNFIFRCNNLLPNDIAIQSIKNVKPNAHARFSATARTYHYETHFYKNPFLNDFSTQIPNHLNFDDMNACATLLLGTQNFASFERSHNDADSSICRVQHAQWTLNGDRARFTITANRFLRNMVRAIVGTLLDVGTGKTTYEQFEHIVAQQDRRAAGQSAPAQGLYLTDIQYPDEIFY